MYFLPLVTELNYICLRNHHSQRSKGSSVQAPRIRATNSLCIVWVLQYRIPAFKENLQNLCLIMCSLKLNPCKIQVLLFNIGSHLRHIEKDGLLLRVLPIYADLWTSRFLPVAENWSDFWALIYFYLDIIIMLFTIFILKFCAFLIDSAPLGFTTAM